MFQAITGAILMGEISTMKIVILAVVAFIVMTTIVKKLFKLALIITLIGIAAYYLLPGGTLPLPVPLR